MAYTTSNRFHQIDTGTEIDTWGDDIVATFQRMDEADDGILAINVSGVYNLIYANDATDQAHFAGLNLVGNGGTVVLQPVPTIFHVRNSGTGDVHFHVGNNTVNAVVHPGDMTTIWNDGNTTVFQNSANGVGIADALAANLAKSIAHTDSTAFNTVAGFLPGQSGSAGNFLTTDGSNASWTVVTAGAIVGLTDTLNTINANTATQIANTSATLSAAIGAVVLNGTLTHPTISNGVLSGGYFSAPNVTGGSFTTASLSSPTSSGGTFTSPTINGATINTAVLTGSISLPWSVGVSGVGGGNIGGGKLQLSVPTASTSLNGAVNLEAYGNQLRFYEAGGSLRGAYIDLTTCGGAVGTQIWHAGNFSPSSYQLSLGFTPYNATNPSGFITHITSANVTSALGYTPLSGISGSMVTSALGYTPMVNSGYLSFDGGGNAYFYSGGTFGGNISVNDIQIRSDARLKTNSVEINNALETLSKLKGYYGLKSGDPGFYVIAQEVQETLPDLIKPINGTEDETEDGSLLLSVNYIGLIPIMLEAINSLKAELDALKGH